jgi:fumarate reductase subunit D
MNASPSQHSYQGLHCPTCNYDLRGLSQTVCPECGEGFDPDELAIKLLAPAWGYFATVIILLLTAWLVWLGSHVYGAALTDAKNVTHRYGFTIIAAMPIPIIIMFFLLPLNFRSDRGVRVSCLAILFSFLGWTGLMVLLFMQ